MREPRKPIRTAFTVVSALGGAAVLHEFSVKYAEQRGWYDNLPDRVEAALSWLVSLSEPLWFKIGLAFVVDATAGLWLDAALRRRASGSTPRPPAPARAYLGRVQVRVKLVSDSAIGFYFVGLNNSPAPMAIKGVRGWAYYRDAGRDSPSFVRLSHPKLADNYPMEFAPGSEFTVAVFHELPEAEAAALQNLLVRDEAEVAFVFRDLHVETGWPGQDGGPDRLPVWDEVRCHMRAPMLLALPVISVTAPTAIFGARVVNGSRVPPGGT